MKRVVEVLLILALLASSMPPLTDEGGSATDESELYFSDPSLCPAHSFTQAEMSATIIKRRIPIRVKSMRLFFVRPSYHAVAIHRSSLRSIDIPSFRI